MRGFGSILFGVAVYLVCQHVAANPSNTAKATSGSSGSANSTHSNITQANAAHGGMKATNMSSEGRKTETHKKQGLNSTTGRNSNATIHGASSQGASNATDTGVVSATLDRGTMKLAKDKNSKYMGGVGWSR